MKQIDKAKAKIAAKVAKGKAKVAKKCGKAANCVAILFCLACALTGCQNPAQRAQTCEVNIYAYDASRVTLGTESVTQAQSNETGGNDAGQVATPKNETTPEIAVGVGGSSAGVGTGSGSTQSGKFQKIGAAADAIASIVAPAAEGTPNTEGAADNSQKASNGSTENKTEEAKQSAECENCTIKGDCATCGECTDGSCSRQ